MSNRKRQMAGGKQEVAGNASEVTIDALQSGIAYFISVSASTKAGAGPSSNHFVRGKRRNISLPFSPTDQNCFYHVICKLFIDTAAGIIITSPRTGILNGGAVAGGIVGGLLLLLMLGICVAVAFVLIARKRKKLRIGEEHIAFL